MQILPCFTGFEECMTEEIDLPIAIPLERWDVDYGTGATNEVIQSNMLRFAALADGIDCFDAGAFRTGPAEAAAMDPQQRVLLEQAYSALQVRISRYKLPDTNYLPRDWNSIIGPGSCSWPFDRSHSMLQA